MGVDLGGLCPAEPVSLESLSGHAVAIDAYNALYQFLAIIRGPDGTPLRDSQGRVTSHLSGLLQRTANLVAAGMAPAYVFDGAPHPLKLRTLQERHRIREEAQREYEKALAEGDLERARSKAQQTSTLSRDMVEQSKRLVQAMGLPVVQAPAEGEAQAAHLAKTGRAHACGSQDFDALLFGAPILLRNLAVTDRRKLPGRQAWTDVSPERLELASVLGGLGLTHEQLVDVALLIGTDYNQGVPGIGPKTALKLIQENGTLEVLLERAEKQEGSAWAKVSSGRQGLGDYSTVRRLFLEPAVESTTRLEWGRLNRGAIVEMLVSEHQFSRDRVESSLEKMANAPIYRRQRSLTDWSQA